MSVNVFLGENTSLALAAAQDAAANAASIASLPTSDPMVAWALWNHAGVRKLSAASPTLSSGTLARFTQSGDIMVNAVIGNNLSTAALVADTLLLFPLIPLAKNLTLSALAGYVTTGVASAKVRFGIYADNGGKPDGGARICDSGELAADTTNTAISGAVSVTLNEGGLYWLAILSGHAPTLRGIGIAGCAPLSFTTNLSGTAFNTGRQASLTYAALPATCPTGTTYRTGAQPAVGLVVA